MTSACRPSRSRNGASGWMFCMPCSNSTGRPAPRRTTSRSMSETVTRSMVDVSTALQDNSDRPRDAGAVENRLVDPAWSHAVAGGVERGHLALEGPVERVGRTAAGGQHHRVDTLDPALGVRENVAHEHRRALDGAQLGTGREDHTGGVQARVQRRDGGDTDVLTDVEQRGDDLDALAL